MIIQPALAALREGKPVLLVDQAGDGAVVLAAHEVCVGWVAWTIRHTSGLLSAPMPAARADKLRLPPMVPRNQAPAGARYTVSVDGRTGTTTGISATDRARTFQLLGAPDTQPTDLIRPGHVLPLCVSAGGVRDCLAPPEAAVELCELAGLPPVAVLATLVSDSGDLLNQPGVEEFAARHGLPTLDIVELLRHPRHAPVVRSAVCPQVPNVCVIN